MIHGSFTICSYFLLRIRDFLNSFSSHNHPSRSEPNVFCSSTPLAAPWSSVRQKAGIHRTVARITSCGSYLWEFQGSMRGTTPEGVQLVVKGEFVVEEVKVWCLCSHPRADFLLVNVCGQHPPGDQSHGAHCWRTLPSAFLLSYCPEPRVLTHLSSTSILWARRGVSSASVTWEVSLCWDDPSPHGSCFVDCLRRLEEFCAVSSAVFMAVAFPAGACWSLASLANGLEGLEDTMRIRVSPQQRWLRGPSARWTYCCAWSRGVLTPAYVWEELMRSSAQIKAVQNSPHELVFMANENTMPEKDKMEQKANRNKRFKKKNWGKGKNNKSKNWI